jgi:hypothetical protein
MALGWQCHRNPNFKRPKTSIKPLLSSKKTYEESQSMRVMIKELHQLTFTTEPTVAQYEQQVNNFQRLIELNKEIENQVDALCYASNRLGYVALSEAFQSRDLEVVVCNSPSIPFLQPLIDLQV